MTSYIIITLCILTLLSYLFDLSGKKTQIPGVILLLTLGIVVRLISDFFHIEIPNLQPALPILGTVGLILIVLEGSLDLELRMEKITLIRNTLLSALVLLIVTAVAFALVLMMIFQAPFLQSFINAIPLGIISSAIAISGVYHLDAAKKEFVVYESTFSDILGILLFNFFVMNEEYGFTTFAGFILQLTSIVIISAAASFGLGMLLQRITHHVKIIPIIAILLLLYSIAKKLNLPSLVLVMMFGLFLNNIRLLDIHGLHIFRLHSFIDPAEVSRELVPFKHLVAEVTFVVRSFFFIMFGYYTDIVSLVDLQSLALAVGMIAFIIATRYGYFRLAGLELRPILFVAPRGLITILLFLSIPVSLHIPGMNEGLLSQMIFLSALVMMFGLMRDKKSVQTIKDAT